MSFKPFILVLFVVLFACRPIATYAGFHIKHADAATNTHHERPTLLSKAILFFASPAAKPGDNNEGRNALLEGIVANGLSALAYITAMVGIDPSITAINVPMLSCALAIACIVMSTYALSHRDKVPPWKLLKFKRRMTGCMVLSGLILAAYIAAFMISIL